MENRGRPTKGVFVNKVPIKSVQLKTNVQEQWMRMPDDVRLYISYDSGHNFDKNIEIGGRFNREKGHWGSALKLKMFFDACGIKTSKDIKDLDWKIPEEWVQNCIGKDILVLSYVTNIIKKNGKNLWLDWTDVMHPDKGYDALKEHFMNQFEKGYVKKFSPDSQEESNGKKDDDTVTMNKEQIQEMMEKDKINISI